MKLFFILMVIMTTLPSLQAARKNSNKKNVYKRQSALTMDQYLEKTFDQSDSAKTAYNNYQNSINSFKTSFRQSRLPTANASSSLSKSKTDVESVESETRGGDVALSLNQPVYPTGGSVSASMSESVSKTETLGSFTRSDTKPSYSVSLSQPVFLFKGNSQWRSWKRAKISYEISVDNYKRTLQTIRNNARIKYFDVIRKREELEVEKFKLKASERAHKITKLLVRAGRYAGIERSRSDVRLKKDRRRLDNAKTSYQIAINEALEFAGLPINAQYRFSTKLTYQPLKIKLEKLLDYAFKHRPDYKAAEKQLQLSHISLEEVKESDNPALDATGSLTRTDSQSLGGETTTEGWSGKLTISWPFFDSRISALKVKSALNDLSNQKIEFEGLKRNIEKEVKNAYLEVKRAEIQIEDLKQSKEEARKTVNVVRIRYKNGVDRLVDVFDSENELRALELEYLDALISANLSKDSLSLQIGGSLEDVIR